jgi:hypothetical protein
LPHLYVFMQIVLLALTKDVADDDDSHKARYLRFCRWIGQGRKDKTAHFGPLSETGPVPSVSTAVLPESADFSKCAECGKDGATKQSSGCLIRTDNHTTFATSYCSKECQVKHWKKHRALCRDMERITRAMALFQDIFEHFLALTCPGTAPRPTEITGKYGNVVVTYQSNFLDPQDEGQILSRFPLELASSPDTARAALAHMRSRDILTRARTLFEMLIRRKYLVFTSPHPSPCQIRYASSPRLDFMLILPAAATCAQIRDFIFDAKNMDKPVLVTRPYWDEHSALLGTEVILAMLPCGETVVLDPTGVKFGWKERVSLFGEFLAHRVRHPKDIRELCPDTPAINAAEGNPRDRRAPHPQAWHGDLDVLVRPEQQ